MNLFTNKRLMLKCQKTIRNFRLYAMKERNGEIRRLRRQAFKNLEKQVISLVKQKYHERIIIGILDKKIEIIANTFTEEGFCHDKTTRKPTTSVAGSSQLIPCSYPYFNGMAYVPSVPEEFFIPEEECVHWANFFSAGQNSEAGMRRYDEVLALTFPDCEESEIKDVKRKHLKQTN